MQLDPRKWRTADRFLYGFIALAVLVTLGAAAFFMYDAMGPTYAGVYDRLGLAALPPAVEMNPGVRPRLEELRRNPCSRDAIIPLAEGLMRADMAREGATSILNFSIRCGPHPEALD